MTKTSQCQIGFVGDSEGAAIVKANCPRQFDVVSIMDLAACPPASFDIRAAEMCVRSLGAAPFDYNIQMDIGDTLTLGSDIEQIFDALGQGFELASAMECCSLVWGASRRASDNLFGGWVMQTGVLGFKKCSRVKEHASHAIGLYMDQTAQGKAFSDAEQPSETLALAKSGVRFVPLPPTFNFRRHTSTRPLTAMPAVVAHWKYNSENKTHMQLMYETVNLTNEFEASVAMIRELPK